MLPRFTLQLCEQPGGMMLASGSADETIRLWNLEAALAELPEEVLLFRSLARLPLPLVSKATAAVEQRSSTEERRFGVRGLEQANTSLPIARPLPLAVAHPQRAEDSVLRESPTGTSV